jgi:hypothetical protein
MLRIPRTLVSIAAGVTFVGVVSPQTIREEATVYAVFAIE